MVLVSFVLVVVAAITLVIGLLQSGLAIIYVSIACSVLAGVVLFVAVLRGRPEARPAGVGYAPGGAGAGPAPAPASWQTSTPAPSPAAAEVAPAPAPLPAPEPEPALASVGAGGGDRPDRTEQLDQAAIQDAVADGGQPFPIHQYDTLRATEILPMLAELDDDQLEAVRQHEESRKNRFMIMNRIKEEVESRSAGEWDAGDEGWKEPQPAPGGAGRATGEFPIADYDELKALQVLGRLPDLSVVELKVVRRREEAGDRRAMVLNRIDRLIEEAPPEAESLVVPPEPGPGRRAARGRGRAAASAPPAKRAASTRKAGGRAARSAAADAPAAPVEAAPARPARAAKAAKAAGPDPVAKAPAPRRRAAATTPPSSAPSRKAAAPRKAAAAAKSAAAIKSPTAVKKAAKRAPATKASPATRSAARKRS